MASYSWLANGTKIGVKNGDGSFGLEYLGSLVYKRVGGELKLESAAFGSGRIVASEGPTGMTYTPNYFITDHLGSTRVVWQPTGDGSGGVTILERNDYHPFGGRWQNPHTAITDNRFRFSGKEEQSPFNLLYQDFGWRMYDARLLRWTTPDPLAEEDMSRGAYTYCFNNPVYFIDPWGLQGMGPGTEGKDWWWIDKEKGVRGFGDVIVTGHGPINLGGLPFLPVSPYFPDSYRGGVGSMESPFGGVGEVGPATGGGGAAPSDGFDIDEWIKKHLFDAVSAGIGFRGNIPQNELLWKQKNGTWRAVTPKNMKNPLFKRSYELAGKRVAGWNKLGKGLGVIGGGMLAGKILFSQQVTAGDIVNGFFIGISFTGWGAIFSGAWFIADFGAELITGESISDRRKKEVWLSW